MRTLVMPRGANEAGLYDPHFASIGSKKYLVYSAIPEAMAVEGRPFIPQPDVYLARSMSDRWAGYWKRVKAILRHEDIAWHHNRREHPDYEWGIEGPQLVELPNGWVLLNATCFIEDAKFGTRQRVFFALSKDVKGPYASLGPVLTRRENEWESGENGHASAWAMDTDLYLFYQARSQSNPEVRENNWRYGIAVFSIDQILNALK